MVWPFIQMLQKLSLGYIECFLSFITATYAILVFESLQKREISLFVNFRGSLLEILSLICPQMSTSAVLHPLYVTLTPVVRTT